MLATGRYAQWQSRFIRYVDRKPNGDALRKCILQGPYKLLNVKVPAQLATDDAPAVPDHTTKFLVMTGMGRNTNREFTGCDISSGPEPMSMTPGQFSSGLIPNQVHATNYVLPTDKDLELLFQLMFDEYFEVTRVDELVPSATAVNAQVVPP
ncbi:hypothetical protein Tco_0868907, partial [Tanacetum coccineum]